jgi:hypothetical protein
MGESRLIVGSANDALARAIVYAEHATGEIYKESPDITVLTYTGLTIEDVRALRTILSEGPVRARVRVVIIRAERFFAEAQNAFLKILEEPATSVSLVLSVPSEATLLPTILSRLVREQYEHRERKVVSEETREFLSLSKKERTAHALKLAEKVRSGTDEDKRKARTLIRELVEEITLSVRNGYPPMEEGERRVLLSELRTFLPLLSERSAPVKMILLHLCTALPEPLK